MARRSVIAIIFVSNLACSPLASAAPPACEYPLKTMLGMIGASPQRVRAIHYNSIVEEVLNPPSHDELLVKFENALEASRPLLPAFPREDFLTWYRAHPYLNEELKQIADARVLAKKSPITLGELLNLRAKEFAETLPAPEADEVLTGATHLKKTTHSFREKNPKATAGATWEFLKPKIAQVFPCLAKNPKIALGVAIGYTIGNAGTAQGYFAQPKVRRLGYTWEGMINGTIWTPVFSEISCRIARKGETTQAGLLADEQAFDGEAIKTAARSGGRGIEPEPFPVSGLKKFGKLWLASTATAPFEDVTYTFFHVKFEEKRQERCRAQGRTDCKEVDANLKNLAHNYGALLAWDGSAAALRKIYVQQPLYYNFLPNTIQPAISARIAAPGSLVTYVVVDAATRFTVSSINSYVFLAYQKRFVDTGKPAKK